MREQSIEEVERICYQAILDQAEAHMRAQDEAEDSYDCFCECVHANACYRIYYKVEPEPEDEEEALSEFLRVAKCCGECREYDDSNCPWSWRGTTRCRGPRKGGGHESA